MIVSLNISFKSSSESTRKVCDVVCLPFHLKMLDPDISENMRSMRRLRAACERAKRALSFTEETTVEVDSLFEGTDLKSRISRKSFEHLCEDLFHSILEPFKKVLRDSKMDKSGIDEVVLVGGSSRIPRIVKLISDFFNGKTLCTSIHPEESVAHGAAVQAAVLSGHASGAIKDLLWMEGTPLTLGIETAAGLMATIFKRNTTTLNTKSRTFSINELKVSMLSLGDVEMPDASVVSSSRGESQRIVEIKVYEGESRRAGYNTLLASFSLAVAPSGDSEIKVRFDIDQNGIVKLGATDMNMGGSSCVTIENDSAREEEIQRMAKELKDKEDSFARLVLFII